MVVVLDVHGDALIKGSLLGLTGLDYPSATILNAHVSPSAAIAASKLQRSLALTISQAGTAVTATYILRIVRGATLTVNHVTVSQQTACAGSSTVTADVQVAGGASILSSAVSLSSSDAAYCEKTGVITDNDHEDGDILIVVITANLSGTDALATGVCVQVDVDEDYLA